MSNTIRGRRLWLGACPAILIVPTLLLSACGGATDSTGATAEAQLSRAQIIATANPICLSGDREINRTLRAAFPQGSISPAGLARYARATGIPILKRMIRELHALPAPADGRFAAILITSEHELAAVERQPSHFGDRAFVKADRMAHRYGLPDC